MIEFFNNNEYKNHIDINDDITIMYGKKII